MENRKRQLPEPSETEPKKQSVDLISEKPSNAPMATLAENLEKIVENPAPKALALEEFPILTSMISAPMIPKIAKAPVDMKPNVGYFAVYNAFRQFLNGYLAAGGDPHLANTLANYAASLPVPMIKVAPAQAPPTLKSEPKDSGETTKDSGKIDAENSKNPENSENSNDDLEKLAKDKHVSIKQEPMDTSGDAPVAPTLAPTPTLIPSPDIKNIMHHHVKMELQVPQQEVSTEIQRLREAAFGRYRNVLCVICNEWICSRNRKNHIEAHLNYRPYKCSACDYSRRREIFVIQHIKTHHAGQENIEMITNVDLNVSLEVDRLADECVERTRKLIDSMQEKKDGDFGEGQQFDEKALELMLAEEQNKKVVVIESVSAVRPKVANYHRRQRTKVLKKIYDTDAASQTELKIVKDEEGGVAKIGMRLEEGFEIKLEDLMQLVQNQEQQMIVEEAMEQAVELGEGDNKLEE